MPMSAVCHVRGKAGSSAHAEQHFEVTHHASFKAKRALVVITCTRAAVSGRFSKLRVMMQLHQYVPMNEKKGQKNIQRDVWVLDKGHAPREIQDKWSMLGDDTSSASESSGIVLALQGKRPVRPKPWIWADRTSRAESPLKHAPSSSIDTGTASSSKLLWSWKVEVSGEATFPEVLRGWRHAIDTWTQTSTDSDAEIKKRRAGRGDLILGPGGAAGHPVEAGVEFMASEHVAEIVVALLKLKLKLNKYEAPMPAVC
ncbi:hypothetical protein CPB84DRAFT_1750804 [Gymnopilus junonius]|uniref:Uncharacterized protein n=1 Tax=Gymnopilus junonius TaxID=109634 RepID=A0A9P5NFW4_GYMJU|nr:hypothetical protein CPB84DRAFT_1750804 [Gymnopilus junonius]